MNLIEASVYVLVFGVIFSSCSKDRQDPLGIDESGLTEGRLTMGADGPNLVVTKSNADSASQVINEEVFSAFVKACLGMSAYTESTEPIRVTGGYSGYAVVDGTVISKGTSVEYDFKITFYDYSDTGYLFWGGSLRCMGAIAYPRITQDVFFNDEIKFAGPYTGFVKYDNFNLPTDYLGNLISIFSPPEILINVERQGTMTFNSGGNKFILNPYPVIRDF